MNKVINVYCLLLIHLIWSKETEALDKENKRIKVKACMKMLRYRIHQDHDYYEEVMKRVFSNPNSTENDIKKSGRVMMLSLNNCYKKIDIYDAEQIEQSDYINSVTPQNKELLNFEEWEEYVEKGKNDTIESEIDKTKELIEMIREEELNMIGFNDKFAESAEQYEEQNDSEENKEEIDEDSTVDLLGMMEMNSKLKYIIGIGLIVMIFLLVVYGLIKLAQFKENKNKKKKKRKAK